MPELRRHGSAPTRDALLSGSVPTVRHLNDEATMKIAITSTGKDLDALVDPRFGRAGHFILFDTRDRSFSVLENEQNLNAPQGAGIQAGRTIVESGAEVLITGNCGPKAFDVLSSAGIRVFIGVDGTVREALEAFKNGSLEEAGEANVEGHWV